MLAQVRLRGSRIVCCGGMLRREVRPKNCVIIYMWKMDAGSICVTYKEEGVRQEEKAACHYPKPH